MARTSLGSLSSRGSSFNFTGGALFLTVRIFGSRFFAGLSLAFARIGAGLGAGSLRAEVPVLINLEGARARSFDDFGFPHRTSEQPHIRLNLDGFAYERIAHFPPRDGAAADE